MATCKQRLIVYGCTNWLLLQRLLQSVGFDVRVAEDGAQAVELFKAWRPHFIWMDIRLPVMSGIEATSSIRELQAGRDVKIVAVTASAFASQREQVLSTGFDDFLRKPYRHAEIFNCMAQQWLADEIEGAQLQAFNSLVDFGDPTNEHQRNVPALFSRLKASADLETVDTRHPNIKQNQFRLCRHDRGEREFPAIGRAHVIALRDQGFGQHHQRIGRVIDCQNNTFTR